MAVDHKITITRGDTWDDLKVGWKDSDGVIVSVSSARMHIRSGVASDTTIEELSTTNGELAVDGDGYITATLTAAETAVLTSGVYDLEATSAGGTVKTLISGRFEVEKDVTRS